MRNSEPFTFARLKQAGNPLVCFYLLYEIIFISYISKSLGVLLNKGTGFNNEILYGFLMHRQFTEYFAAIKLEGLINAKIVKLKNIIFDSKWTEIITLMGSFMNSQKIGGKLRINRVIRDILKIQSKPINCLEYNTQLVLKLMANNVYLESDVLKTIESRIYNAYQENNSYKILQMCNEFILMFGSIYHSFIYNILYNSLIAEDYRVFSSACIVVNEMHKYPNICQEALAMLNKDKLLVKALERLVLTEKDSAGFFKSLIKVNACILFKFYDFCPKRRNKVQNVEVWLKM